MPALPAVSDFTGATRTNAEMKVTHAALHAYLAGLFGTDGAPGTALATLGALGAPGQTVRSAATTLTAGDRGRLFTCFGTWAMTLPLASAAGAGWSVLVHNWGVGTVTLTRAGSDLVDGGTVAPVVPGMTLLVLCTGTEFITIALATGHGAGRILRTVDITTSATDATAGRLLKVGDFGLGGTLPLRLNISVTDNSLPSGLYSYDTVLGSTGGPVGVQRGHLIHLRRTSGGGETQVMIVESSTGAGGVVGGLIFSRARITGAWSAWMAPGVVESVINANGRYVRRQDGTQECWRTLTASTSAGVTWTFPAAFSEPPVVTGTAVATVLSSVCLDANATATSVTLSARDSANARRADVLHLRAVGRWF